MVVPSLLKSPHIVAIFWLYARFCLSQSESMERRGFFKHLVGQLAQAASGGYVVEIAGRSVVFYEGATKALPLWLAPATTAHFDAVCHVTPQPLNDKQQSALAVKTECTFTRVIASNKAQKADGYILFAPKLSKLPVAPTLLLFSPAEAQKVVGKLAEVLRKLPAGSDIFVGNLDDWQTPSSPVHGRIQLFLSSVKGDVIPS